LGFKKRAWWGEMLTGFTRDLRAAFVVFCLDEN
jgi:hypothetical protein